MKRPEQQIQIALAGHLAQRSVRGVVWFHVPNGGKMSPARGARLKSMGVRAGVSDIIAIHKGRVFALELKAPKGNPTESQMQFISDVNSAGGFACIATGIDQAIKCLETWGLIRGEAA